MGVTSRGTVLRGAALSTVRPTGIEKLCGSGISGLVYRKSARHGSPSPLTLSHALQSSSKFFIHNRGSFIHETEGPNPQNLCICFRVAYRPTSATGGICGSASEPRSPKNPREPTKKRAAGRMRTPKHRAFENTRSSSPTQNQAEEGYWGVRFKRWNN